MKKLWFLKGRTGRMLKDIRDGYARPFTVTPSAWDSSVDIHTEGRCLIAFTVRGSSRNRRQQARQLGRWLNEE